MEGDLRPSRDLEDAEVSLPFATFCSDSCLEEPSCLKRLCCVSLRREGALGVQERLEQECWVLLKLGGTGIPIQTGNCSWRRISGCLREYRRQGRQPMDAQSREDTWRWSNLRPHPKASGRTGLRQQSPAGAGAHPVGSVWGGWPSMNCVSLCCPGNSLH